MALILAQSSVEAGLAAAASGRHEEAVRLLGDAAAANACPYDCLLALGVAQGRLGRLVDARTSLDRAIALDGARPDAFVERGGLSFLEARYDEAARDLARALALREDDYTRDLLASALHLAGRSDEALARWNRVGRPVVQSLRIEGLTHTRDFVARRELRLGAGDVLDLRRLRESRAGLAEVGVFDRITLRPVPLGEGQADLEVALTERHGFGSVSELLVGTGVGVLQRVVRLRYANLDGSGVSLGGHYRWQENRPEGRLWFTWPRPFGLPVYFQAQGVRGRQAYDLDGPFDSRYRGGQLGLRTVLGARTTGELAVSAQDRTFSVDRAEAQPGWLVETKATLERRLVEARRARVHASIQVSRAASAFGSDVSSWQILPGATFFGFLAPPDGVLLERSVVALRLRGGWSSARTPVDRWFAPGTSPEMELPLRAHFRTREGILGETPVGPSLALVNLEWRRRLYDRTAFGVGLVLYCDLAHIRNPLSHAVEPPDPRRGTRSRSFQDVGAGLRLKIGPASLLRIDYSHGLSDGKNALSIGMGHLF